MEGKRPFCDHVHCSQASGSYPWDGSFLAPLMASFRILVADDHESVRAGVRALLSSRSDWKVCGEACNGREAVEKAKVLRPDLVLMDVTMPEMGGVEAARIIRKEIPDTAIIMISQNDKKLMQWATAEAGAKGYIEKSKLPQELVSSVEVLLGKDATAGKSALTQAGSAPRTADLDCLAGGGEMGELMRSMDWGQTALGPISQWPQSLKTSVSICLASRFPIVMYWGPEYVVLYNDAYSTILGSKHPWALGQRCRDCWAEIWETIGPMLDSVVNSAQATWSDDLLLMLRRHGYSEECYFSFSFSPIRIETGAVGGVFTAVMETTEKVIGERRLRTLRDLAARAIDANREQDAWRIASETLSENLQDVPFSVLCQVRPDSKVHILGTAGIGRTHVLCTSLCTPGSKLSNRLEVVARSREAMELLDLQEFAGELPTGEWRSQPVNAVMLPVIDRLQESSSSVLVAAVSPHKKLDESYRTFFQLLSNQIANSVADARSHDEERKRVAALAELDRAKTLFFSNISHEFRTPLTLMLSPLEDLLAAGDNLVNQQRERLEVAHRNSLRLLKLVNTLLDFSRIEAGRLEASYVPTDLASFTADIASVFRSIIERAGIRLVVECPTLPELVYVDQEMWEKIVLNLLSNAFKFTFEGEIAVSVRVVKSAVEMTVCDTGTGVPREEIPRLFERFHRVKGAQGRSYEGSGIGLALVQELVKLHGGSVGVESEVGKGSKFIVRVPLGKGHLPADRISARRASDPTGLRRHAYVEEARRWLPASADISEDFPVERPVSDGESTTLTSSPDDAPAARILLAEDNADMRAYVQRLLRAQYQVIPVSDGEAALRSARERSPDLILSDVMMPRMDGFGLLKAVREDEALKDIPVILLSARAGEESRVEGLNAGADDYLIKPFSARELLARVSAHLAMARLRRQVTERERELRVQAEIERDRIYELFMQAPAAIGILSGPEHRWTFLNSEYLRVTGRDQAEAFIGKTIRESLPELEGQGFLELLDNVYRTGVPFVGTETKVVLKVASTGEPREVYFNFVYQPLRDMQGRVEGVLVHAVDVTQEVLGRIELEERGRASGLLAAIVDSSDDAIVSKNLNGVITSWNRAAQRLFGYTAKEAVGKHVTLIIPPERHREEDDILRRLRRGERVDHFETVRMRKDGTRFDVSLTISPVKDSKGRIIGASKVARDISERKQTERALRQSEESFRKLSEALDAEVQERTKELQGRNVDILRQSDLLRELAHRLLQAQDEERRRIARELHDSAGQTLTVLGMNLAQLVQKAARNSPQLANDAEIIQQSVQQLHREIRTASYLLHPPLLDEAGLASALAWYTDGLVGRSQLEIRLDIAEDFGRLPRDMELLVFRLVQECLTNIHRHSGSKTASIRLAREPDKVAIEISDTGKGMSPEKLAEIQTRGSGVGIRGMRERVRQFNGKLEIYSGNSGTRIFVTIPNPADNQPKGQPETHPVQATV
jgi:PAS domain S-box-containing protein